MADRRKWLLRLTTLGVSIALFMGGIAIAEVLARFYGLGKPILYYENVSYRYAVAPNQSTTRFAGAQVHIDQYGLRTSDNWDAKGATRILFLGDSVTYGGSYIDNRELFSAKTCEALGPDHHAVCGNAATNGYGTDNMTYRIRFARLTRPDAYVVTIISEDTLRGLVGLPGFPYFSRPLPPFVPGLTEVSLFGLDWIRARLRFDRNGGPYQGRGPDAEKVARLSLKRLFAELQAKRRQGSTVLLVHSPSKNAVRDGYSRFDETVLSAMRRAELPLLEIRGALTDHPDLNAIFHDGAHLDPAGHALYGELVARALLPLLKTRSPH